MRIARPDFGPAYSGPPRSIHDLFRLCACPLRVEIFFGLVDVPGGVTALADHLEMDIASVSHHLRPFRAARLVLCRASRGRHEYSLAPEVRVVRRKGWVGIQLHAADGNMIMIWAKPRAEGGVKEAQIVAAGRVRTGSAR